MARHAKKRKINKVWISVFCVLGVLVIASWLWLLLYFPPVSSRAETFIKTNFEKIFRTAVAGQEIISETPADTADIISDDNDKEQSEKAGEPEEENKPNEGEQEFKPAIQLKVYEGPLYDGTKDVCYYIVRAVVSGNPEPSIQFSRNDSSETMSTDKTRIDLKRSLKSYTLTATASNSLGTVMDSLTLTWGCNSPPVIEAINLSTDTLYVNEQYDLTAKASDADNENIQYKWTVEGGTLENDDSKTVRWNTPSEADDYVIKVEVRDSSGNTDSKSITVYVGTKEVVETTQPPETSPPTTTTGPPATEPQEQNLNLPKKTGEGGYLEYGGKTFAGGNVYAGDSENNRPCVGFISFDISDFGGKDVVDAKLTFSGVSKYGDPLEYLDAFWINVVEWGAEPIVQNDFNLTGIAIQSFTTPGFNCTADMLKSRLQTAIDGGKSRFQIRVHFSGPYTDNDNSSDGWQYSQTNVNLNVTLID